MKVLKAVKGAKARVRSMRLLARTVEISDLPATTISIRSAALLATLLGRRLVVAHALLLVCRFVVIALVVALQAMRATFVGTRSRVRVFHNRELGARQIVQAQAGVRAMLLLAAAAPRIVERHVLRVLARLGRSAGSVFLYAAHGALAARMGRSRRAKGRTRRLIDKRGSASDAELSEDIVLYLIADRFKSSGTLVGGSRADGAGA